VRTSFADGAAGGVDISGRAAADMKNCGECGSQIGVLVLGGAAAGGVYDLYNGELGTCTVLYVRSAAVKFS